MDTNRKRFLMRLIEERDGINCHICELPLKNDRHPESLRRRSKRDSLRRGNSSDGPLATTLDHVTARREGGHSELENLCLSHKICNNTRGHAELTDKLKKICRDRVESIRKTGILSKPVQVGPGGEQANGNTQK